MRIPAVSTVRKVIVFDFYRAGTPMSMRPMNHRVLEMRRTVACWQDDENRKLSFVARPRVPTTMTDAADTAKELTRLQRAQFAGTSLHERDGGGRPQIR